MSLNERLAGLSAEEIFQKFSTQERLTGLSTQEHLTGLSSEEVFQKFSTEERLMGLSVEELENYLDNMKKH